MRHFLIVGGTSGIGLQLSRQLSSSGHSVTITGRNQPDNLEGTMQFLRWDVTTDDGPEGSLPEHIDGMAYCPGSITLKPFRSLKPSDFQKDFEINVLGAVRAIQAARKALKRSDSASIVLFSTVAVSQGMVFHTSIAAAKGAVESLTRSLAAEWAPDIRVNCIAPSLTDTPLAASLLSSDEKRKASGDRHPLRRVGQPADISAMAAFLLSEEASWISGQVIAVDGGMSTLRV